MERTMFLVLVQGLFLGSAHVSERAVYDEGTLCDMHRRYKRLKQWINLWSIGFENISVNIKSRRQFVPTPANTWVGDGSQKW